MGKLNRTFHEKAALELLGRDGIAIVWKVHLEAAEAYQAGYQRGAQIPIETADAAERLLRHAASAGPFLKSASTQMLYTVEVRFAGETFRELMLRVRGWLNSENAWPSTFRYWFSEPDALLRVNFQSEEQARAFAEAFGGVVLTSESASRAPPGAPPFR